MIAGQETSDPSTPYAVPTGGGEITQWQTYTASDTAGATLTFAVLRPTSGSDYAVVGLDAVTLPTPLPTDHIASFTPSSPIQVQAGDILAMYTTDAVCAYAEGSTPADDSVFVATGAAPPTIGEGLGTSSTVGPSFTMNVAATLSQTVDAGVQTSTFPSTTSVAGAGTVELGRHQ